MFAKKKRELAALGGTKTNGPTYLEKVEKVKPMPTEPEPTKGYQEEYRCGCLSPVTRFKKDLPGYCPRHGEDKRSKWKVDPEQDAKLRE
jgi:hypothetical protein